MKGLSLGFGVGIKYTPPLNIKRKNIPTEGDFLLLENGYKILLEDSFFISLESKQNYYK